MSDYYCNYCGSSCCNGECIDDDLNGNSYHNEEYCCTECGSTCCDGECIG